VRTLEEESSSNILCIWLFELKSKLKWPSKQLKCSNNWRSAVYRPSCIYQSMHITHLISDSFVSTLNLIHRERRDSHIRDSLSVQSGISDRLSLIFSRRRGEQKLNWTYACIWRDRAVTFNWIREYIPSSLFISVLVLLCVQSRQLCEA